MKLTIWRDVKKTQSEPWYYDTLRSAISQYIEDNSYRYKDFIVENIEDYLSKIHRNEVWGGNYEIQAFSEIYSENVNIHKLDRHLRQAVNLLKKSMRTIQSP